MRIVLFFILISLIQTQNLAYAYRHYDSIQNPLFANFNNPNLEKFDVDTLNYLENSLYGRIYPYNTTASRLKKLEKTIFGTTTNGLNSERLKRLSSAYNNYKRDDFYSNNARYNAKHNLKRLSKMLFNGVPTGYTPPVNQNYYNPNRINTSGYGFERVYCDSLGNCSPYYQDITTNMGVKIIRN